LLVNEGLLQSKEVVLWRPAGNDPALLTPKFDKILSGFEERSQSRKEVNEPIEIYSKEIELKKEPWRPHHDSLDLSIN
jgi:hypothetical protein